MLHKPDVDSKSLWKMEWKGKLRDRNLVQYLQHTHTHTQVPRIKSRLCFLASQQVTDA